MERVIENTKDSVTCPICTDVFDDARMLTCSHSFCLHCLTEYRADSNGQYKECPICRDVTVPPLGSLEILPANDFANKVVEVIQLHNKPEPSAPPDDGEIDGEFYVGPEVDDTDNTESSGAGFGLSLIAGVAVGVLTGGIGGVLAGLAVAGVGSVSSIEADRRKKTKFKCSGCNQEKYSNTRYMCGICDRCVLCPLCFNGPDVLQLHNSHHIFLKLKSKPKRVLPPGPLLKPAAEQMSQSLDFRSKVHRRAYMHTPERLIKLPAIKCRRCGVSPIVGTRYKCGMCKDYDICGTCENSFQKDPHNDKHVYLVFKNQAEVNVTSEPLLKAHFY